RTASRCCRRRGPRRQRARRARRTGQPPAPGSSALLPARDLDRQGELLIAAAHLAVELSPERLLQGPPDGRGGGYAGGKQIVARHLEPDTAQIGEVAVDRTAGGPGRRRPRPPPARRPPPVRAPRQATGAGRCRSQVRGRAPARSAPPAREGGPSARRGSAAPRPSRGRHPPPLYEPAPPCARPCASRAAPRSGGRVAGEWDRR